MRKLLRVFVVVGMITGLLAIAPSAFAAGKPETFTEHERDFTDTFTDVICLDGEDVLAEITIVEQGVFHITELGEELYHLTGTFTGTFVAVALGSDTTYTGRYTTWFGENDNQNIENTTFTFRANGVGSDGTRVRFSQVGHITADEIEFPEEDGDPLVEGVRSEFFKGHCA